MLCSSAYIAAGRTLPNMSLRLKRLREMSALCPLFVLSARRGPLILYLHRTPRRASNENRHNAKTGALTGHLRYS